MTDREFTQAARIYDLERRLKRAHQRAYEQRKRARHWRYRALRKGDK